MLFNRTPGGDAWATYFIGAYGLGVLAAWGVRDGQRARWCALIVALGVAGLWLQWRDRLALALVVALVLLWQPGRAWLAALRSARTVAWLASVSYALFLVHYPVSLLVNAAFERWLPHGAGTAVLGLGVAWLASLGAAWALWQGVERRAGRPWQRPVRAGAAWLKTE